MLKFTIFCPKFARNYQMLFECCPKLITNFLLECNQSFSKNCSKLPSFAQKLLKFTNFLLEITKCCSKAAQNYQYLLECKKFCSKIARNYHFLLDNCTNSSIYLPKSLKNTHFCPKIATIYRLPCPKFTRNYQIS